MESYMARESPVRGVPADAFVMRLHVRSYEATRSGRITPAVVLRYLEYLATQASAARGFGHEWYEQRGSAWVVRDMALLLGPLPSIDDYLRMATWLSEFRRVQACREYAIWHEGSGRIIARGRARWAYIDRVRGIPIRIHDDLLEGFGILGNSLRERLLPPAPPALGEQNGSQSRRMTLTARDYEADTQQHINNCVYVDWLEEASHDAVTATSRDVGWATTWQPRWYAIEYARPTVPGDHVGIETQMSRVSSRRLDVWQTIRSHGGTVNVRAYSQRLRVPCDPTR